MEYDELTAIPKTSTKEYLTPAIAFTLFPLVFLVLVFSIPDTPKDAKIVVPLMMSIFLAVGITFSVKLIFSIREALAVKLLNNKGRAINASFEGVKQGKRSNFYHLTYSFKNDYNKNVFRTTKAVFNDEQIDEFKRAGFVRITYYKNCSRISHSDKKLRRESMLQNFERYAREDKMFTILKKELDKEITVTAKNELLAQHSDLMPIQTKKRLEEYISFTTQG